MGKLTAVSLFSGCGGFDWGAQQAGVEVIWANDNDPHAAAAYQSLFPEVNFVLGDVCDIDNFPVADIVIGCYPCTGFSVGARRRWRNEEERDLTEIDNNFLYKEFLRALGQVKPKYFFVENVRGMKSAHDGWFFKQQRKGFEENYNIKHALLNAAHYGVGQARERIFIVGIHKDISDFEYDFSEPTHGPGTGQPFVVLRDVIEDMERWPEGDYLDYKFHGHYLTRNRKRGWDELGYTVVANASHVPLHPMGEPMKFVRKDTWQLQGNENRRLSWRECAAIQDLPDHVSPSGGLSSKYRVVGNAVPPALGRILLEPVVKFEGSK